ncbi:unnamed protein product [Ixodes pacificus]
MSSSTWADRFTTPPSGRSPSTTACSGPCSAAEWKCSPIPKVRSWGVGFTLCHSHGQLGSPPPRRKRSLFGHHLTQDYACIPHLVRWFLDMELCFVDVGAQTPKRALAWMRCCLLLLSWALR